MVFKELWNNRVPYNNNKREIIMRNTLLAIALIWTCVYALVSHSFQQTWLFFWFCLFFFSFLFSLECDHQPAKSKWIRRVISHAQTARAVRSCQRNISRKNKCSGGKCSTYYLDSLFLLFGFNHLTLSLFTLTKQNIQSEYW